MITFRTEETAGVLVAHLTGEHDPGDRPEDLIERLAEAADGRPLVVDLTDLEHAELGRELVVLLDTSPWGAATVLVHEDLRERRRLRSTCPSAPVVPDVAGAITNHGALALDPRVHPEDAS